MVSSMPTDKSPECDCAPVVDPMGTWHAPECSSHKRPARPERASKLHSGPNACVYCTGPVSKGGLDVDGHPAHKKCHKLAVES